MIAITSGALYTDIDAYACAVAYAEGLNSIGVPSRAVLPGRLNFSVPAYLTTYSGPCVNSNRADAVVLVDISDPDHLPSFARPDNIIEVFDHHFGFEAFWATQPAQIVRIEPVGAAATLIVERLEELKAWNQIGPVEATLLAHAIISNTVDMTLPLTTERDHRALKLTADKGCLTGEWRTLYFQAVDHSISADLLGALRGDCKQVKHRIAPPAFVAQLELSSANAVIETLRRDWRELSAEFDLIIVSERLAGRTHFFTSRPALREALSLIYGTKFINNETTVQAVLLRKLVLRDLASAGALVSDLTDFPA